VPLTQIVDAAVQMSPVQQGSEASPHPPQLPSMQVPPMPPGQVEPAPVQVPLTQHPPLLQSPRSQHASPGPPQGEQTPLALQALPGSQLSPGQQVSPAPPQLAQVPASQ
jgi:hypothetical protein